MNQELKMKALKELIEVLSMMPDEEKTEMPIDGEAEVTVVEMGDKDKGLEL